jgi:hypothetical protein
MKIYVVSDWGLDGSDCSIFGVYSTPEKAEAARKEASLDHYVECFDLDAPPIRDGLGYLIDGVVYPK